MTEYFKRRRLKARKEKAEARRPKFVKFKWRSTFSHVKDQREQIKEQIRRERIVNKTYSTYAFEVSD